MRVYFNSYLIILSFSIIVPKERLFQCCLETAPEVFSETKMLCTLLNLTSMECPFSDVM